MIEESRLTGITEAGSYLASWVNAGEGLSVDIGLMLITCPSYYILKNAIMWTSVKFLPKREPTEIAQRCERSEAIWGMKSDQQINCRQASTFSKIYVIYVIIDYLKQ